MIELVIYALLAAFVFSRLYNSLGKSTTVRLKKLTRILDVEVDKEVRNVQEDVEEYLSDDDSIAIYKQIMTKNKSFSISNFMEGAGVAFELIIKYFNQGNSTCLKPLLDKDLYNHLVKKIQSRQEREENHESTIVSIISQKIIEIKLVKNMLFIAVYFLSEQICFVRDNNSNIVSGSTTAINRVKDVWQFKRAIGASDHNWLLVSINYEKVDEK